SFVSSEAVDHVEVDSFVVAGGEAREVGFPVQQIDPDHECLSPTPLIDQVGGTVASPAAGRYLAVVGRVGAGADGQAVAIAGLPAQLHPAAAGADLLAARDGDALSGSAAKVGKVFT